MNACVQTYTEPQTSSTRSCGLGRRIHGSVEDTKLSTNKQHSPSLQPRIRVRPVPAYRVRSCCVGGRRESERLRAMGAGRRCLAPRVGGGSWSSPPHCGVHLGVVSRGNLARTPDVAVVISLNLFLAPVDDTVTTHSKTQVTRGCGRMAGRSGQCLAAVRSLVCVDAGSGAASGGSFRPVDLVAVWGLGLLLRGEWMDYRNAPDNAYSGLSEMEWGGGPEASSLGAGAVWVGGCARLRWSAACVSLFPRLGFVARVRCGQSLGVVRLRGRWAGGRCRLG